MTPTYSAILAAALLAGPAIASAQAGPHITAADDGHLGNDSRDADVTGNILLVLGNDPPGTAADLTGAVQLATIVHRFGTRLSNSSIVPTWLADAEFRAPRVATQP